MDYYKILNIDKNAQAEEIKKAYKNLAMIWHPDKNKDPMALNKFKEINEAYQILSDKQKKMEYDNNSSHDQHKYNFNFVRRDPFEMFNDFFSFMNEIHDTVMVFDNILNVPMANMTVHIVEMCMDDRIGDMNNVLNIMNVMDGLHCDNKNYNLRQQCQSNRAPICQNNKKSLKHNNPSLNKSDSNKFQQKPQKPLLLQNDNGWTTQVDNQNKSKINILNDNDLNNILNKSIK